MLNLCLAVLLTAVPHTNDPYMWGVTVDSVYEPAAVVEALSSLAARPFARVVFDPGTTPKTYASAVSNIHRVAKVMGSPVDSAPPSGRMTVDAYRERMAQFMDGLGDDVDVWEVGNEVNGDWTGDSVAIGSKVTAGFNEAKARHRPTALTLFYSDFYRGTDRDMTAWSTQYLPATVRNGLDYVLVSFYPATATGEHPDWSKAFAALGRVFPKAKLGFGELGLRKENFTLSDDDAAKAQLIKRYYRMPNPLPGRFIGGFFWWTFRQDAIPKTKPLWKTFDEVIRD